MPGQTRVHACSLAQALEWVGERWTFLVLREALAGTSRYGEFRKHLGIASDVLAARLSTLVEAGIMERETYQEPGQRRRERYRLTESGRQLGLVLGALQQWGDAHVAEPVAPSVAYRTEDGRPVSVAFVDGDGAVLPHEAVHVERVADGPDAA